MKKIWMGALLLCCLFTANAQSKGQMSRRIDTTSIPADILSKEYVLLFYSPYNNKKLNGSFEKSFRDNYSGLFEVVPFKTDLAATYADVARYRYVLTTDFNLVRQSYDNNKAANPGRFTITAGRLYLIDRKTGKIADTGLEAQDTNKILGYYLARASGKQDE